MNLQEKEHKYLGAQMWQNPDGSICESMEQYIEDLQTIKAKWGDPEESDLDAKGTKTFRSLMMKLCWPAHKLLMQMLYRVSALAQKVNEAKVKHVKEIIRLVRLVAKDEAKAGRARLVHQPMDLSQVCIVTYFEASLGKEHGCRSQAGMMTFFTGNKASS